jgi:predicted MPP superfamily phosphohydrolase
MAVIYYGFLLAFLVDIIRLLDRAIPFLPMTLKQHPEWTGLTVVILLTCILSYGFWNARHPVINRYEISIAKHAGNLAKLHAVAVSDIHLGNIIGADRLEKLVESINQLQPDIVLLPGDIIDAELQPFITQNMGTVFRRLNPPLGVYAVLGNHEYIGGEQDAIIAALEQAGVKVLRDSRVIINNNLVVAGRDERSRNRYAGGSRAPLSAILAGINPAMPVLLLDHQPVDLEESKLQGVDLQLSGHTHRGQLYPNHLITSRIFEIDWGHLKKDSLQVIVSSGYGTWGPPIRTGNQPELLDIYITFQE